MRAPYNVHYSCIGLHNSIIRKRVAVVREIQGMLFYESDEEPVIDCFVVCIIAVAFKMYDLDDDDSISRTELLAVLHMMVGSNISEDQV